LRPYQSSASEDGVADLEDSLVEPLRPRVLVHIRGDGWRAVAEHGGNVDCVDPGLEGQGRPRVPEPVEPDRWQRRFPGDETWFTSPVERREGPVAMTSDLASGPSLNPRPFHVVRFDGRAESGVPSP
jgi:hypothetical protein